VGVHNKTHPRWENRYIRVDYDETFAPIAKMSIVKTLISIAANNLLY
jgi:hypothetical protein